MVLAACQVAFETEDLSTLPKMTLAAVQVELLVVHLEVALVGPPVVVLEVLLLTNQEALAVEVNQPEDSPRHQYFGRS